MNIKENKISQKQIERLLRCARFIRKTPDPFFVEKDIHAIYAFLIGWTLGADIDNIAIEFVKYIAKKKETGCAAPSKDLVSFEDGMDLLVEFLQIEKGK